jgi:hypothetical protein
VADRQSYFLICWADHILEMLHSNDIRGGIMVFYAAIAVFRCLLCAQQWESKTQKCHLRYAPGPGMLISAFDGYKLLALVVYTVKACDHLSGAAIEIMTGTGWDKEAQWKPTDDSYNNLGRLPWSKEENESLAARGNRATRLTP